jgi:cytochrome b561
MRYDRMSIALHWLVGLAILLQFALGWWMVDIPKDPPGVRAGWFNLHKSIGLTVAAFVVFRLLWRASHPGPALPGTLPQLQRLTARGTHWLLYACMLVMPLSGYLGSSFTRYPVKYFGSTLPHWGWEWPAGKTAMSAIHLGAAWTLAALLALHLAGALWHLLRRDGLFSRMAPSFDRQSRTTFAKDSPHGRLPTAPRLGG